MAWQFERKYEVTRAEQAANGLGVGLATQRYNPLSVYGREQWSVEAWDTDDGRHLIISGDKNGFDAVVLEEFDYPCTAYNREGEQIELAHRAGLSINGEE